MSFIFSFNSIIANPVRTILSLLGVTIGIFTIIAVLSTVDSLERSIKDNLSFLGTDNLRVEKWPWDFDNPSYEWWKFWKRPHPTYKEYTFLKENLNYTIQIYSHSSSTASDEYNMQLSKKRMNAVVKYYKDNNIDITRISYKAYGESKLINLCGNDIECEEEMHRLNRRTEIKLIIK